MVLGGLAAIVLALLWVLPVLVNLPDSLGGGLIVVALAAIGIALIYRGGNRWRATAKEGAPSCLLTAGCWPTRSARQNRDVSSQSTRRHDGNTGILL